MIYRLMYRGAAYADSLQYHHCIDLWKYALELRIAKDTILYCDTCFTAQALVKLFLDLQEKHCRGLIQTSVRPAGNCPGLQEATRKLGQGPENPVSSVAAGDPAGQGTCHRVASQEKHTPAGGSDGPTHNPGRLPPPPLCQQEQHTQDPGFLRGWRTKG